jgi:hypothetical protein
MGNYNPVRKQQRGGGSVTVLPQFLECYPLRYEAFSGEVSITKSMPLLAADAFTVTAWM